MLKRAQKIGTCFLGTCIALAPQGVYFSNDAHISMAEEQSQKKSVNDSVLLQSMLADYSLLLSYDDNFSKYLSRQGVTSKEYKDAINNYKKYSGSNLEKVEGIETLSCIFDTVMYTYPTIKTRYEYNVNKKNLNKEDAWREVRKSMLYDTSSTVEVFEKALSETADMETTYKYLFNKVPSSANKGYLNNRKTIRLAFYSGYLGRELTDTDVDTIENGKGYTLFNITESEYSNYRKYKNSAENINRHEIEYMKVRRIHENVASRIKSSHKKDIFSICLEHEMKAIYEASLIYQCYNEDIAYDKFIELLKYLGNIESEKNDPISGGISDNEAQNPTPFVPESSLSVMPNIDFNYGEAITDMSLITRDDEEHSVDKVMYTDVYYFKIAEIIERYRLNNSIRFVVVDVNGQRVVTDKEITSNTLSYDNTVGVYDEVLNKVNGKRVSSLKEDLLFVNNKIATININEKGYTLAALNESFKDIPMKFSTISAQELIEEYEKLQKELKEKEKQKEDISNKDVADTKVKEVE